MDKFSQTQHLQQTRPRNTAARPLNHTKAQL
jgi:hypothetical protein